MATKSSFSKIVGSATIGNILEYYDFLLFVYLAPHISSLFFPPGDSVSALIAGLGIYALGYFMRPLGGILFGYIGDTYGRKKALTTSIIMMAIPTALIGCLPTYQSIGIFSPLLLTLCRLLQGLCVGGEYNGASIFTVENVKGDRRTFAGSLITSSSAVGGLLGSAVAGLVLLSFMPPWAWRGAFIAGALIAIFGLYIRLKVIENNPIVVNHERAPLLEAIKNHPRSILCTMGIAAFSGIMFHMSLSYISIFLATVKHWPLTQSLGVVSSGMVLYIALVPLVGKMADSLGVRNTMISGALATIVGIYPALFLLTWSTSLSGVLMGVFLLVSLSAWFQAPMNYYMATLFPPKCRYSGVAFSYSLAMAIFGGTTSMILTFLIQQTNNPFVCGFYVLFGACLGLLAVIKSKPILSSDDPLSTELIKATENRQRNHNMSRSAKKNIVLPKEAATKNLLSRKTWMPT